MLAEGASELVVSVGREGKTSGRLIDPKRRPHAAAMARKLAEPAGQAAYRKRKWSHDQAGSVAAQALHGRVSAQTRPTSLAPAWIWGFCCPDS